MKSKLLITAIITLVSVSSAYAKTDITGDIYGQVFNTMLMDDVGLPYGVTIDDLNEPTENCDNSAMTCFLSGFSWSDVVGWTYWDGAALQTEIELITPGSFPNEHIAKITYNGNLGGYIWGEKFGWISLSACGGLDVATCGTKSYCDWSTGGYCEVDNADRTPEVSTQDMNDWGVYLDFCPLKMTAVDCESAASDQYCNWDTSGAVDVCVFDSVANPNGQPFGGYAWSEYLGWVKFGPETGEETDFSGAYTNWFPDLTPPHITIPNPANPTEEWDPTTMDPLSVWIPNESNTGTIYWDSFVDENESYVDLDKSILTIEAFKNGAGQEFATCPNPGAISTIISPGVSGEADLSFPNIGRIGEPPNGFCKYLMSGVLYNASGFGFYFGDEGTTLANNLGILPIMPGDRDIYDADPITINVRAGDTKTSRNQITSSNNNTVADGDNTIGISFKPYGQLQMNRIMSVRAGLDGVITNNSDDWIRNVELVYKFNEEDDEIYTFDSIDWTSALLPGIPSPIDIEADISYKLTTGLQYPQNPIADPIFPTLLAGGYPLDITGYAPTTTVGNTLRLNAVDLTTHDVELPVISSATPPTQGPWPAKPDAIRLETGALPFDYYFEPALVVTAGELDSDFLAISQSAEATFKFINNSTTALNEYSFDNILSFTDGGSGSELLEVKDINLTIAGDLYTGRTDPNGVATRYGLLYSGLLFDDAENNQFHSNSDNYHDPVFSFENNVNVEGVYEVSGNAYVAHDSECLSDDTCDPMLIDRSDSLATGPLSIGIEKTFAFGFVPSRYLGGSSSGLITFDIDQYLSYFPPITPFSQSALYPADPFIQGIQVKSLGLDTSGTVSGGQIYESSGDRDLETITTTSSADLRREIRKNVAVLTRNMTPCDAPLTLSSLSTTNGGCIAVDEVNKTIIAYYASPDSGPEIITLENAGFSIEVPDGYRYTIILDAVDLSIEENIIYPAPVPPNDPNTSFGIIVIQDSDGNGGNVYLDHTPTNIVGLLYAEGSLFSRNAASGFFYYGGGGDAGDLKNQLFWQGSIATRNTIGGASTLVIPKGVDGELADCSSWDSDAACSQAYDLDFIRRFTTINESGVEYSPANYLFSGGGECVDLPPITCNYGGLPTTVTLSGLTIDVASSKSLDTFFIERDNRPVPPGFSSSGGLTSSQEIR